MPLNHTKKGVTERLYDYPFAHTVAAGLAVSAIDLIVKVGPNPQGNYLAMTMAFFAVLAGIGIVTGLQWRGHAYMAYGIERSAHFVAIGAWVIDVFVLVMLTGWSLAIAVPLLFVLGHILRIKRLGALQRHLKKLIGDVREAGAQS